MMPAMGWILTVVLLTAMVVVIAVVRRGGRLSSDSRFEQAKKDFHAQREYLEARFIEMARQGGKPRGLEWEDCDFDDDVSYARSRQTGTLSALVAVTVRFSAIEGGDMEDVEAVGNLRAATGVFLWRDGRWTTNGRVVFNMNPTEAIDYFKADLEMIGREIARPA